MAACLVAAPIAALALRGAQSPPSMAGRGFSVVVEKNLEARMRDGVVLRADVYRPDAPGRFSVLLQRTPYSKNPGGRDAVFRSLAASGFVVIVQDSRGRYTSDGVARPHDEAEDGHDTVEWAAALRYANGGVGMFGTSYLATTSLQAASEVPAHLAAIQPSAAYSSRYHDLVYQGGAFYLSDGLAWNLGQAADVRRRTHAADSERDSAVGLAPHQQALFRQSWLWHVPLKTFDALDLRRFAPNYFEMLDHPTYDAYWEPSNIAARFERFDVPALHIVGWYDVFAPSTIANFVGLRTRAKTEHARRHQRLVVGFWPHAQPGPATTRVGDVDFGVESAVDLAALRLAWFRCWLADDGCSAFDGPPVRLFVMGENRWRDEHEWPLARARNTAFYLESGGRAETLDGDGRLVTGAPRNTPPDRFLYDPWDPVPTGQVPGYSRLPADQRAVEERADVLVYTTEPLRAPVEVTGPISLVLWAASSARDTDFTAKLVDVHPDGTARLLTDGILRARYRESSTTTRLLEPGTPTELTIDVGVTSNLFKAGHRIRLEVSSSNFPRYDRNPNTGGPFGEDARLQTAEQTVFHDVARPSRLMLPIVPR
ncbi:MAG TPA: CocE/NonD family hydrolase [Vicinamibacterales bacterium]|nr:CocE/NonD family hydrolase [Vicinamibacterales bacterium]